MVSRTTPFWAQWTTLAQNIIYAWAILGGVLLALVVTMNAVSVVGAVVWQPFPGDFEMTEIGVAVAAFAFLPYCQLTGANVSADIFTSGASPRSISFFKLLGSLVAAGFSLLLFWRMGLGMMDQHNYGYTTSILRFPHWTAFLPILISLALLFVAALITTAKNLINMRDGVNDE